MKTALENSRAEALLMGKNIPALGGKVIGVKKVQNHIRQIQLEGGKVINVPVTRLKSIVEATIRVEYAKNKHTGPSLAPAIRAFGAPVNRAGSQRAANFQAMWAAHAQKK